MNRWRPARLKMWRMEIVDRLEAEPSLARECDAKDASRLG